MLQFNRSAFVAGIAMVLLTAQSLWGWQVFVSNGDNCSHCEFSLSDTPREFNADLVVELQAGPNYSNEYAYDALDVLSDVIEGTPDCSEGQPCWNFFVGLEAVDFDYNHNAPNITYFDGIDGLRVKFRGNHKVPPDPDDHEELWGGYYMERPAGTNEHLQKQ